MAPGGRARAEDGVGTPATLPTPALPRTPLGCPRAHPIRAPPCSASPWPPPRPGAWPRPPPGCRRADSALPSAAPSSRPSMMLARARAPPTWSRPASTFGLGWEEDIGGGVGRGRAGGGRGAVPADRARPDPPARAPQGKTAAAEAAVDEVRAGLEVTNVGSGGWALGGAHRARPSPLRELAALLRGSPPPALTPPTPPALAPPHSSRPCPPPPHSPPPLPPAGDGGRLGARDCGRGKLGGRGAQYLGSRRARRAPVRRPGTGGDQRRRRNLVRAVSVVGGRPDGGCGRPPRVPACGARRL